MNEEPVIGIDLGTTNSEVAVFVGGRVETVEEDGSAILPSCVGLDPAGNLLVGVEARNQLVLYPERTVRSVKRKMGTDAKLALGDRVFRPEEISAMILRRLKERAEQRLGRAVSKAVITVPAQFNDAQRQATRDAGAIAGLEVLRIINEPTAACLAYEAAHKHGARTILAFDLGGGTFDVSIVRMEGDIVEVIASHGDNQLGGDDFDAALSADVVDRLYARQEQPALLTPVSLMRLSRAAETAKTHLSDQTFARLLEDQLTTVRGSTERVDEEIARLAFEELLAPFLARMAAAIHSVLAAAGLKAREIDEIVLVGGSSRIPAVQDLLEREFGKRPRNDVHPELAVAYGAGVMASRLMGATEQRILVDITPYTFGTSCLGEVRGHYGAYSFAAVIRSGSPLPVRRAESFYTAYDNQKDVEVNIFQGENEDARENTLIGRFLVKGLSAVPHGNEIVLHMALDLDGILRVTATEKVTGLSKEVAIENALLKLDAEQIEKSRREVAALFRQAPSDAEEWDGAEAGASAADEAGEVDAPVGASADLAELLTRLTHARPKMDATDQADTDRLLARLAEACGASDADAVTKAVEELEDILFYLETE
ncbi:MAG: Hsp70 family protein [bacterium]